MRNPLSRRKREVPPPPLPDGDRALLDALRNPWSAPPPPGQEETIEQQRREGLTVQAELTRRQIEREHAAYQALKEWQRANGLEPPHYDLRKRD